MPWPTQTIKRCTVSPNWSRREATANDIQRLIEMVKQSGGIEYAQKVMEQYAAKAEQCLDAFQNPAVKEGLRQYLMYVIGRKA